jgi:Fe2+ or Zn2+ uptake regulation protein
MLESLDDHLRGAGLRVTAGRVSILDALARRPHSTAEALHGMMRIGRPTASIQSVHNVLGDLTAAGLIRRIEPAGSAALYERRVGDNHHHVVCTECAAVADVDCVHGSAPCLEPDSTSGYAITTAEVTFWGLCPACQESKDNAQPKERT